MQWKRPPKTDGLFWGELKFIKEGESILKTYKHI